MTSPQLLTEHGLHAYCHSTIFRKYFADLPDVVFDKVLRYGAPVGSRIEIHDRIPRCMGRLQELIVGSGPGQEPLPSGTVVMARELRNSCGRFDREWFAPRGGLWLALAWADTLLPEYARFLPLAAGSACCEAVRSYGVDAAIKWVNDIHVGGRKIGGILCETFSGGAAGDRYQLIGIGINCNNVDFPSSLKKDAISMQEVLGTVVDVDEFALRLLGFLCYHFGLVHLTEEQGLQHNQDDCTDRVDNPVLDAWRALSDTPGQEVMYGYDVVRSPLYRAKVEGVDQSGGLVLKLPDGQIVTEHSGEILYL